MDIGTAFVGLISVAVSSVPFVLTTRSRKKNEKELLQSIKNLAKNENCEITQSETCGNYAIGIDETKNFVFFQSKSKEVVKHEIIDLATIKKCKVVNISSTTADNDKIIEKLNLDFSPISKNKSDIILEFYNSDISFQLSGELQSLNKWNTLINKMLISTK